MAHLSSSCSAPLPRYFISAENNALLCCSCSDNHNASLLSQNPSMIHIPISVESPKSDLWEQRGNQKKTSLDWSKGSEKTSMQKWEIRNGCVRLGSSRAKLNVRGKKIWTKEMNLHLGIWIHRYTDAALLWWYSEEESSPNQALIQKHTHIYHFCHREVKLCLATLFPFHAFPPISYESLWEHFGASICT